MTEGQLELLRDKFVLWDRASREGAMDLRDYNRRAAEALKQLLAEHSADEVNGLRANLERVQAHLSAKALECADLRQRAIAACEELLNAITAEEEHGPLGDPDGDDCAVCQAASRAAKFIAAERDKT